MANIDPAFIKLTPVGELETKTIPENTDEFLIYDEDGELKKSNWGDVFELVTGGLTRKTTDVQYGEKIIKKFLGYINPDGTVNPLDQAEIDKYISIYGGYTSDPAEAMDYAPEPGADGNQFYSLAEMPNLAYGNWGDVVEVNNKVYKKTQTKKVRYIKIETGGTDLSGGVFLTWLKAFDANGVNVAVAPNITVTTSHPITEGVVANLADNSLTSYIYIGNVTAYSDIRWFQIDLESVKDIAKIEEAMYPGRKAHDKRVMISEDGVTWETLFYSNTDGEYTESNTVPSTRMLSGWHFMFNVNTPIPTVADTLVGDTWDLSESKKTLVLNANKSISVTYSEGAEGELTVDGKGNTLSINGQSFVTDSDYKMHFRLLEMNGELVILPAVTKALSASPFKEISQTYLTAVSASSTEQAAVLKLTEKIKPFYDKIIALYLNLGSDLAKKTLNLVRPFEGKENFQQTYTAGVINDANDIKVPSGSTNRLLSNVEPLGLSDLLNYGFFFHKKQLVEGGNWVVGAVGEDGSIYNQLGSYHPKSGGSNDYIQMFSSGFSFPSKNEAGLISIRRNSANKAKISVNKKADFIVDIDTDTSHFVPGANQYFKYPILALIGQNGDAVYSCWGIYQSLTDYEHSVLMETITEFLTAINRI